MPTHDHQAPRVFISYSWSSDEYSMKVLELATRLRQDGIDVVLDKWDLKTGHDVHAFMESMVTDEKIERVIILCDAGYQRKADTRSGGVGAESQIISSEVYGRVKQEKFLPVVMECDAEGRACLPAYLRGRIYIDLGNADIFEANYERLLRDLHRLPLLQKPALGKRPISLDEAKETISSSSSELRALEDSIRRTGALSLPLLSKYFDAFAGSLSTLTLDGEGGDDFDDTIVAKLTAFRHERDQFVRALDSVLTHSSDADELEPLHEFFRQAIALARSQSTRPWSRDAIRFASWELFLYTTSLCIKRNRPAPFRLLTCEPYFLEPEHGKRIETFVYFSRRIDSLDSYRNQRVFDRRRVSVSVDLLKERAQNPTVPFERVMEADLVVALRAAFLGTEATWIPTSVIYRDLKDDPFDIFLRATTRRGFARLSAFLEVTDLADFITKFEAAFRTHRYFREWRPGGWPIEFLGLVNFSQLQQAATPR